MALQRDTADVSPPRTPPSQSARYNPQKGTLPVRPSLRDAFPDEMTSFETANGGNESGDEPDPHDLSLSPQHAARTSIVDNMLLSLDQFASGTSVIDDYRLFNSALESGMYRASQDSSARARRRGHTFSSSLSSDTDMGHETSSGRYASQHPKVRRSNSSSNYRPALASAGSARNRDGQRYPGRGSKSSTSSNVDFGNALGRDRAESDSGSASFDCGPRKALAPFSEAPSDDELSFDETDAAPTPNVPAGPRKTYSPRNDLSVNPSNQSSRTTVASRRNSMKSARSSHAAKPRQENIGTSAVKSRGKDSRNEGETSLDLPPPPVPASLDPPAPSPTISYNKSSIPPPEPPSGKERPGFFRRVFGSSKNSSPGPSDQGLSESPSLQSGEGKGTVTSSVSSKGQGQAQKNNATGAGPTRQVVNKKSSFFRRRKKSVVDSAPPPIVVPQEFNPRALETKPEPSPVSSLRKVMNPYLADADAKGHPGEATKEYANVQSSARPQKQKRGSVLAPGSTSRPEYGRSQPTSRGNDGSSLAGSGSEGPAASSRPGSAPTDMQQEQHIGRHQGTTIDETKLHDSMIQATDFPQPPRPLRNDATAHPTTTMALSPVVEGFSKTNAASKAPHDGPVESKESGGVSSQDRLDEPSKLSPAEGASASPTASTSEASNYYTASNTPVIPSEEPKSGEATEGAVDSSDGAPARPTKEDREQAQKLYDSQDEVVGDEPAAAWLGDVDRALVREAYMGLFDWSKMNVLAALRSMCIRLVLKGETQQVDRVLDAFSSRWCECNPRHGFKTADVVHTICYSLLLLNTDLHLADIDQKMTKNQFVRNTLPTIHRVAVDAAPDGFETVRPGNKSKSRVSVQNLIPAPSKPEAGSVDDRDPNPNNASAKPPGRPTRVDSGGLSDSDTSAEPLVSTPFNGTIRAWEQQVEGILRDFYTSILKERLPLHGARQEPKELPRASSTNLLSSNSGLRRSPSNISKSSDIHPRGRSADSRYGTARFPSKARSRVRLHAASTLGSRTSLDDQSSLWSPSASSTWSKPSLGKLTSASVGSFDSEYPRGEYQQSVGFANALSQAIIREDPANSVSSFDDTERMAPLLEDETLALAGAPWAKEGSLNHKHHLDSVQKRAKDRNWSECFAVIQQGWMRLFSFSGANRSVRQKTKQRQNVVVGGGNWMENAEEVWKFLLRQTIASALPPPGYSKSRPHVWALSLPTGAVHLFQVGTPEIAREFVSTANYWSARLSKEPLVGGISNIEYGWGDSVINGALVNADSNRTPPSSSGHRPSLQSSIRSSIDQQTARPKLPADRVHISDWSPPQQSMAASSLSEDGQLSSLQNYVRNIENELQRHNELRSAMMLAFSPRHPNASKALANWERKSSYLLREIVKFRTYIDSLQAALGQKKKIFAQEEQPVGERKEGEPASG
ncbi:Sec7 domain protein [Aspergillus sp. HF37]|nr:Sec7 domain protein [Aspergillus sp. HF37]